jgi:hypothetical protein
MSIGSHDIPTNATSIGILCEGNFENVHTNMSEVQRNAVAWLINHLWQTFPNATVTRHRDHSATACPGRHFPFNDILQRARNLDFMSNQTEFNRMFDIAAERLRGELSSVGRTVQNISNTLQVFNRVSNLPTWARAEIRQLIADGVIDGGQQVIDDDDPIINMNGMEVRNAIIALRVNQGQINELTKINNLLEQLLQNGV